MFEIKGEINTAICFAKIVEDEAVAQIKRMCDMNLRKTAGSGLCRMYMPEKDVQLVLQ